MDNAGNIFKGCIENLRSPLKSSIPNKVRYQRLLEKIQKEGQIFPIYVNPGNKGVSVSEIKLRP